MAEFNPTVINPHANVASDISQLIGGACSTRPLGVAGRRGRWLLSVFPFNLFLPS